MITKQNLIKCAVFHIFFNLMNQTRTKTEFIELGHWLELISICLGNERCIVMSYEKIFSDHSYNLEHPKNNFEHYILIQWPSSTRIGDAGMSSPLPWTEALHQVGSAHWSPISLVPHLIGPLLIGPPTHWSPNTLLELIGPPSHWSPISLVPHLIGPPFHSSPHHRPIPMVPHLIGPPSHWFPISLVPQLISLPSHWSPNWHPCITHSIGPPSHWSPRLIGPPSHWSPNSLVLFSLVPQFISPQLHIGPPFHSSTQFRPIPMVPHLTGPLSHWSPNWHPHTAHSIGPPSHWSPIALVPSHRLGPQFISPHPLFEIISPPSHWSPNVTLYALFSLVTHLIGTPL